MGGPISTIKKIEVKAASVSLRSDSIIKIELKPDLIISLEDAKEIVAAIKKVGAGKKHPELLITGEFALPASETRTYMASAEANEFTLATAFVIQSVAQKLVGNVYLKIDQPSIPSKMFNSEEEAIKWLYTFL